jgi:poly(3-hydroxybutyrate) depolymerase
MLRYASFAFVCAMAVLPIDQVTRESLTVDGKSREFFIYVPDGAGPEAGMPLLILLHGSGRDGRSLVDPWKDLARDEKIILAAPNATDRQQWVLRDDSPYLVAGLVDAITAKHKVDTKRLYLFGHSAGAIHAITLGLLESEYFAAVGVHAGALPSDSFDLIDYHDRKIPTAIWVGTNDKFFPVPLVEATKVAMEAKGLPVTVELIKNHTHDYYGRSREINRAVWAFLKEQRLNQDPKFKPYDLR